MYLDTQKTRVQRDLALLVLKTNSSRKRDYVRQGVGFSICDKMNDWYEKFTNNTIAVALSLWP